MNRGAGSRGRLAFHQIMWDFPLRDMDQTKSTIYVNDKKSSHFINHPLQNGYHYKAEFTSKAYDEAKDTDFLPEN